MLRYKNLTDEDIILDGDQFEYLEEEKNGSIRWSCGLRGWENQKLTVKGFKEIVGLRDCQSMRRLIKKLKLG